MPGSGPEPGPLRDHGIGTEGLKRAERACGEGGSRLARGGRLGRRARTGPRASGRGRARRLRDPLLPAAGRDGPPSPRELAEALRERLLADDAVARLVESVEVAGPGFLNFRLRRQAFATLVEGMLAEGEEVGRGTQARPLHILLEYVSVNPNGPLHVGHGRYAAYGNALDRILRFAGHRVTSEFYINDYGRQMEMFGRSVAARYGQSFGLDLPVPEEGYQGEYVKEFAARIRAEVGDQWVELLATQGLDDPDSDIVRFFRYRGCDLVLEQFRAELGGFRVTFDTWFSETPLHNEGRVQGTIDHLLDTGDAYVKDDAVWLRTSPYGDDKDRVLIRSNERPTYFAADIAYHQDKLSRGYDHLINIWGADHHGYIPRMKAAVEILAHDPSMLEVIIGQMVNLLEAGELRQMSTRSGEMVTLAELVEAIGVDAARFFLVMRSHDQTLDLDLDLARQQSQENPVYYVQYAHARIASILRNLPKGLEPAVINHPEVYVTPYERDLIKSLEEFGGLVLEAAHRRAPHRVAGYAQELAGVFHVFYKHCRVIGAEPAVAASRLALVLVAKRVLARCLDLLGVSAPESM
ncbi:MAG: arginine--tRNA ligase [Thermoleophilia bacterium]|nr:arginine--tRNA ligase [Thermoleophilia bacterium]